MNYERPNKTLLQTGCHYGFPGSLSLYAAPSASHLRAAGRQVVRSIACHKNQFLALMGDCQITHSFDY